MSESPPSPPPATPEPPPPPRPTIFAIPAPPQPGWSCLGVAFGLSLLLNLVALVALAVICAGALFFQGSEAEKLTERPHSGNPKAKHNKVAILHLDGVIMEGLLSYAHKQIEAAARDADVKAVVLRINSPGGTITASDDLHRRLVRLRNGTLPHSSGQKALVVSMGSLAASGGYYVSMPAQYLFAEETTLTGSIGVYAAFPNVKELGDRYGFKMEVIKRGEVKDGGSPFKEMTAPERQVWQDMVDGAYERFLTVVRKGRPVLAGKLRRRVIDKKCTGRDKAGKLVEFRYVRRLADGGIFTARQALKFKLVDEIGYLDKAIEKAAKLAGLEKEYRAIEYERPRSVAEMLLGIQSDGKPAALVDPARVSAGLSPRLWYLAPGSELAGFTAALRSRP